MPPDPRQSAAREVYLNSREVMNRYGASSMWIWRRLRDELGFPPTRAGRRHATVFGA